MNYSYGGRGYYFDENTGAVWCDDEPERDAEDSFDDYAPMYDFDEDDPDYPRDDEDSDSGDRERGRVESR